MIAIDAVIGALVHRPGCRFVHRAGNHISCCAEHVLVGIPAPDKEGQPEQMSQPKHLGINDLSDHEVIRLTRFNHEQLRTLYKYFGIEGLLDPGETMLHIPIGHFTQNTTFCYRVHHEEAFQFPLIKILTGMTSLHIVEIHTGGDCYRWSKAYSFLLRHLNAHYEHHSLLRFVNRIP